MITVALMLVTLCVGFWLGAYVEHRRIAVNLTAYLHLGCGTRHVLRGREFYVMRPDEYDRMRDDSIRLFVHSMNCRTVGTSETANTPGRTP